MVHMFCTLKEAAERLHISEEQVEAMLQNGILREFREGPYRLVKAAEVGALAAAGGQRQTADGGAAIAARSPRPSRVGVSPCAAGTIKPAPHGAPRPRNAERVRQPAASAEGRAHPGADRSYPEAGAYARQGRHGARQTPSPVHMQAQSLSLREWLWNGLTQDRPVAIAILFGLVLTLLAVLAAGVCLFVEGL